MGRRSSLLAEKADPLLVFDMVKVLRRVLQEGGGRCEPIRSRELRIAFAHAHKLLWLYLAPPNKAGVQKWVPRVNPTNIKERLAQAGIDRANWDTEDELALTDELKLEWAIQHQVDEAIVNQERELKEKRRKAVKARAKAPRDEAMNGDAPPPLYRGPTPHNGNGKMPHVTQAEKTDLATMLDHAGEVEKWVANGGGAIQDAQDPDDFVFGLDLNNPNPTPRRTEAPVAKVDQMNTGEPVAGSCSPGSYFDDLRRQDELATKPNTIRVR